MIEPTGPDIYAALRVGGAEVMTRLPAGTSLAQGQVRTFRVDMAKAIVFDAASGAALMA